MTHIPSTDTRLQASRPLALRYVNSCRQRRRMAEPDTYWRKMEQDFRHAHELFRVLSQGSDAHDDDHDFVLGAAFFDDYDCFARTMSHIQVPAMSETLKQACHKLREIPYLQRAPLVKQQEEILYLLNKDCQNVDYGACENVYLYLRRPELLLAISRFHDYEERKYAAELYDIILNSSSVMPSAADLSTRLG